ncbi:MAG: lysylphosphatidylglycerol synthase transmembrane domain-containing protein, partial [Myxococcota bacterium]
RAPARLGAAPHPGRQAPRRLVKLAINIGLSLLMLGACLWLVWPSSGERDQMMATLAEMDIRYAIACACLMPVVHVLRAWRWKFLLAPLGVHPRPARLLAISSVGFMSILALPARLGEFVRPALIRTRGRISAAEALGTIAVERIGDGLMVSLLVFATFTVLRGPDSPVWMMPTAYVALAVFSSATAFLLCALRWPERTVDIAVRMTLSHRYAPRLAELLRSKLADMLRGFAALRDRRNLAAFAAWTVAYWSVNGLSMWVLAMGFQSIDLPVVGAFAIMGLIAVGIMLPNSPGLLGQFQWFCMLGLSLSIGEDLALHGVGKAYANLLYGIQVIWYIGIGGLALATPYVSISDVWSARSLSESESDHHQPVPTATVKEEAR